MGANDLHCLRAFLEAEAYDGPSIIIAYSHCIAHGYDLARGIDHQKAAVDSGYWQLFRYNPELIDKGENPLKLEKVKGTVKFEDYAYSETRYKMLTKSQPEHAKELIKQAEKNIADRISYYKMLAEAKKD